MMREYHKEIREGRIIAFIHLVFLSVAAAFFIGLVIVLWFIAMRGGADL